MRRNRPYLHAAVLGAALSLLLLRLPPGQRALTAIAETWVGRALGARVEIGQLRTNLWDAAWLRDVTVHPAAGGPAVRLRRLDVLMASGPPFGDGVAHLRADGLEVVWHGGSPETGSGRPADPAAAADYRRWLPQSASIRGLRVRFRAFGDTADVRLSGALEIARRADGPGPVARLAAVGDSLRLRVGAGRRRPLRLAAEFDIGRRWLEIASLSVDGQSRRLRASGSYEAGAFEARAEVDSDLQWLRNLLPAAARSVVGARDDGRLQARLRAHGPLRDPLIRAHGEATGILVHGQDVGRVRAGGSWTRDWVAVDSLHVAGDAGRLAVTASRRGREATATVRFDSVAAGTVNRLAAVSPALQGRLSGDLDLRARVDTPVVEEGRLVLRGESLRVGSVPVGDVELSATFLWPRLRARFDAPLGQLAVDGSVESAARHRLRWRADGLDLAPLSGLAGLTPIAGRGSLTAITHGPFRHPAVEAELDLHSLRAAAVAPGRLRTVVSVDTAGRLEVALTDGGQRTHLRASGSWRDRVVDVASLSVSGLDVSTWLAAPHRRHWSGALSAHLRLHGDLDRPQATGRVRLDDVGVRGQRLGDVAWQVGVVDGRVEVQMAGLDSTVRLAGSVDLRADGLPFVVGGTVQSARLQPFLALLTDEPLGYDGDVSAGLDLRGDLQSGSVAADVLLRQLRISTPDGSLALVDSGRAHLREDVLWVDTLAFAGSAGRVAVGGSARQDGPVDLHCRLDDVRLQFLEPFLRGGAGLEGALDGRLLIGGTTVSPRIDGAIAVAGLRTADRVLGDLSGELSYARGTARLERLDLHLPSGGIVHGEARAPWRPPLAGEGVDRPAGPFEASLELRDVLFDAGQGLPDNVTVAASGRARLSGPGLTWADLTGAADLTSLEIRRGPYLLATERPLRLRLARGFLDADSTRFLVANGLRPGAAPGQVVIAGSSADGEHGLGVRADDVDVDVLAQLAGWRRTVSGTAQADVRFRGAVTAPDLTVSLDVPRARVDSVDVADLRAHLHYGDGDLTLHELEMTVAGGWVQASGGSRGGAGGDPRLRFSLHLEQLDLSPFRGFFPATRSLDALSGRLGGSVELDGTRTRPLWQGRLTVDDGAVQLPGLLPAFEFERAAATLAGDSLSVDGLRGRRGGWSLSGAAHIGDGRLSRFDVTALLNDRRLEVPGTMWAVTAGHLHWAGGPDTSTVSGQLIVREARIEEAMSLRTLAFAAPDSVAREPGRSPGLAKVALAVGLEGRQMLLHNDLARIPFTTDLLLRGNAALPVLEGRIEATEGVVYYMGKEFAVERARFVFDRGQPLDDLWTLFHDPSRLDPAVDLRALTELKATNGNEYGIALDLSGRLRQLQFRLTSDPEEREMDILSLLSFGRTGVPMADARGSMLSTKANLSPAFLLSMTESRFSRVFGLDEVQIDNDVLRPGRLAGSRIVLTKQLGKRTEMTYSTTVGYAAEGRVQLQYDLGRSLYLQTQHDARGESGVDLNLKVTFR